MCTDHFDFTSRVLQDKNNVSKLYWVIFKRYWSRLFITCFAWILNDLAFYGNKLFQSTFIAVISGPNTPLFKQFQWTLLNSTVSLAGCESPTPL